jgi:glycosyltransferase involved in cell wall biosynthesis
MTVTNLSPDPSAPGRAAASAPPRVSVIMPAFNEASYVRRSIDSILAQTFRDFELIVVDDGSTDGTWGIVQGYDDPRIVGVRGERGGVCRAVNRGLEMARGEYLARMDADDESLPERLERQVRFLDAHPSISILGTAYYKWDALHGERYARFHPETDEAIRRSLGLYIPICQGTVMFRREVYETIGGYDPTIPDAEDMDLWLRAAPHFRFANLPEPLYVYWFDPEHSFFEQSMGRLGRTSNRYRLSVRAIRELGLPVHYHLLAAGQFLYGLVLPTGARRLVRRWISSSREEEIPEPTR